MNKKNQEWLDSEIEKTKTSLEKLAKRRMMLQQALAETEAKFMANKGRLMTLQETKVVMFEKIETQKKKTKDGKD